MTTTPLPPPDTHCFDEDTNMDVWSYSAPLVEQIVKQARADLEAEVARLREELAALRKEALEQATDKTHRCIKCLHAYRPPDNGESEDCPACGHDGTALKETP